VEVLIAWCAFLGAWLLVAGPLLQAALELREEDRQTEQIEAASTRIESDFPRVSPWWWLLPPVHYWLQRRRAKAFRDAVIRELTPEQLGGLFSFSNKATGWLYVAGGAALIGVKETWELTEAQHWPHAVFWVLVVAMPALCTANAAVRIEFTRRMLGQERPPHVARRRS
jgi:hypothetical protein